MMSVLSGAVLLVVSIVLKVSPPFMGERIQYGLAVVCVIAAISLLFRHDKNPVQGMNKSRSFWIGISVLIPVAITGWFYNRFIAELIGPDEQFGGIYSFFLWGVLMFASLPIWGQFLRFVGIISPDESRSFRKLKTTKRSPDQNQ